MEWTSISFEQFLGKFQSTLLEERDEISLEMLLDETYCSA
jgi:hypothetical protein